MNWRAVILILIIPTILMGGCKKNEGPLYTGTSTIDNTIYPTGNNYYALGFSFELGEKIKSTDPPGPDVIVLAAPSGTTIDSVYFDTPNLTESFAKVAEPETAQEAIGIYDNLTELGTYSWRILAGDLSPNQVWVFRTRESHYVKIRIIEVVAEMQGTTPFAQVKFQWRIQPDGTTTFPGE